MALIKDYMPPSRENWEWMVYLFQFFPIVCLSLLFVTARLIEMQFASIQWLVSWYGSGKTSVNSRFNIPGKIAWLTMEAPGFLTLLYIMNTLPAETGLTSLPWENKAMAALFVNAPPTHPSKQTSKLTASHR